MEEFKVVFENYEVSNFGNLRKKLKNGKYKEIKGSILNRGYRYFQTNRDNKRTNYLVHHLVAKAFLGERPEGKVIDHIDRNPLNNNVDNLRWVTFQQNQLNTKDTKHPYIYWREERKCYKIDIRIKSKRIYTSNHKDLDQAILVRDAAMILLDFPNDCYTMSI